MKLTGDLKKQVEKAETKNEKKSLIENAGMLLSDDELEKVSGGVTNDFDLNKSREMALLKMEIAKFNKESSLSRIKEIENGEIEEMNRKCRELGIKSPYES